MIRYVLICVSLSAASIALPVCAQSGAPVANSTRPAEPKAATPPLVYRSVFDAYRVGGEETTINWRDANDRVGAIGGWRFYAREAQQPERVGTPPSPSSTPAPDKPPQHKH